MAYILANDWCVWKGQGRYILYLPPPLPYSLRKLPHNLGRWHWKFASFKRIGIRAWLLLGKQVFTCIYYKYHMFKNFVSLNHALRVRLNIWKTIRGILMVKERLGDFFQFAEFCLFLIPTNRKQRPRGTLIVTVANQHYLILCTVYQGIEDVWERGGGTLWTQQHCKYVMSYTMEEGRGKAFILVSWNLLQDVFSGILSRSTIFPPWVESGG
jgi:hypothetical protein